MNESLRLLGRPTSGNVMKVLWTLAELDLPYTREDIGGKYGGTDTPAYRALNPNGLVPTLIDGEVVLWESNTICRYLCNKAGPTPLYPTETVARALCERWMDWQLGTLAPPAARYWRQKAQTPPAQQDAQEIAVAEKMLTERFALLDRALATGPYVAGTHLTLADVCLGHWAHRWFGLGADRATFKNLYGWYERLKARPGFVAHVLATPFE